jgi:hypothetical protein
MSARDAELLQILLERGLEAAQRRAGDDEVAREQVRSLARFVERCRSELAEPSDARLVASILSRTTRQDPGWRGDLVLVGRFVRETLSRSALARAAAALFLVPLLGAPVLGWMVWRAVRAPEGFTTRIELEEIEPFLPAEPESPPGALEFPGDADPFAELPQAPAAVVVTLPSEAQAAESRAAAAHVLRDARWPALKSQSPLAQLLSLRGERLADRRLGLALPVADLALGRALEVEHLLDQWAVYGEPPPTLDGALQRLGADSRAPLDVRRLEALALDRARSYGRVDGDAWARLAHSGARPGVRSQHDPLDRRWRVSLAAALEASVDGRELLREGTLRAWLSQR